MITNMELGSKQALLPISISIFHVESFKLWRRPPAKKLVQQKGETITLLEGTHPNISLEDFFSGLITTCGIFSMLFLNKIQYFLRSKVFSLYQKA